MKLAYGSLELIYAYIVKVTLTDESFFTLITVQNLE